MLTDKQTIQQAGKRDSEVYSTNPAQQFWFTVVRHCGR